MRLCLASNILEHDGFCRFAGAVRAAHPDVAFLVAGDLLNVFPEPGEDLGGSIFHELYGGTLIFEEMERLVATRFRDVATSRFLEPLAAMFVAGGATHARAKEIAARRYGRLFERLGGALGDAPLYFIPGNMDYPAQAFAAAARHPVLRPLDTDVVQIGPLRVGGLGGIPNSAHPFRGVAEISPYEMTEAEYDRRLRQMWGVDVLVTHLSPDEYRPLDDFLRESPARLLICRAPFDFRRAGDYRGKLAMEPRAGKHVIKVRPFDYPENSAYILDLERPLGGEGMHLFHWAA